MTAASEVSLKFRFVDSHRNLFSVPEMCRVLMVGCSGFYAFMKRGLSRHRLRDRELKVHIQGLFEASRKLYGSPRIHWELRAEGIRCGVKRVARLMQELDLAARVPKKFVRTTDSDHLFPTAPNVLNRKYQVEAIARLNQAWGGDITYIATDEGWLYLAVVLDLKSRRVIGWSMADNMEQSLVQNALEMATGQRLTDLKGEQSVDTMLLFHSDRGSQYASHGFQKQLQEAGIQGSMSRKGNCWDNAPLESFFATLKKELVYREKYQTRQQAKASLFAYIETFYNRIRRHSTLGYLSPQQYEQSLLN